MAGLAESNDSLPPGLHLRMCVAVGLVGGGGSPPPGSWLCMLSPSGWLPSTGSGLFSNTQPTSMGLTFCKITFNKLWVLVRVKGIISFETLTVASWSSRLLDLLQQSCDGWTFWESDMELAAAEECQFLRCWVLATSETGVQFSELSATDAAADVVKDLY